MEVEDKIRNLVRQQGTLKAKLNNFRKFIKEHSKLRYPERLSPSLEQSEEGEEEETDDDLTETDYRVSAIQLAKWLKTSETLLIDFEEIHAELVAIEAEANLQKRYDEYAEFESQYYKITALSTELA